MGTRKLKVIVADDSVVYRSQIRSALEGSAQAEVIATAANGKIAIERMIQTPADLLILDLEMPEMDGLATLTELAKRGTKCKTLVFSSQSKRGAEITLEALRLGASDFVTKPGAGDNGGLGADPALRIRNLIEPKIAALFPTFASATAKATGTDVTTTGTTSTATATTAPDRLPRTDFPHLIWDLFRPAIVVIGSSTGGPSALEKIFERIRGPLSCPLVITQHMPPIFTATIAERFAKLSGIPAREAVHGERIENQIYLAPGDFHLRIEGTISEPRFALDQRPPTNSVRPAVDALFESAAQVYRNKCLGFVLTGMGADGRTGAVAIKQQGGAVVIQDRASCVVFGMPGAVQEAGAYDREANLDHIIEILREKIAFGRT